MIPIESISSAPDQPRSNLGDLSDLVSQLRGQQEIAKSQNSPFFVNILPNQDSLHYRIIDVMDACAAAGVEKLSFSKAM